MVISAKNHDFSVEDHAIFLLCHSIIPFQPFKSLYSSQLDSTKIGHQVASVANAAFVLHLDIFTVDNFTATIWWYFFRQCIL